MEKYFQTLIKIETIYATKSRLSSKKLHDDHLQEMKILQQLKEQKTAALNHFRYKLK